MDELLLSQFNKDFSNSAALCFMETWLNDAIPDSVLHLSNFQLFRADHDTESTGKSCGGRTCVYINDRGFDDPCAMWVIPDVICDCSAFPTDCSLMVSLTAPAVGFLPCLLKAAWQRSTDALHFGPGFVCVQMNFGLRYTSNITTVHYSSMHLLNFIPLIPDCLMLFFFLYNYILLINYVYYWHFLVCPVFVTSFPSLGA